MGEERDLRGQQILSLGIASGGVLVLALGFFVQPLHRTRAHPLDVVSILAVAQAVLMPALAFGLRLVGRIEPKALHLVTFALLEGSLVLCGVSLLVNDRTWPLWAAGLPLLAMVAWFPR